MQQTPGKHLQSHSQLDNSYTVSRLVVPLSARASARNSAEDESAGLHETYSGGHSTQHAAISTSPLPPLQCSHTVTVTMLPAFASESFLRKKERGKELKAKEFFTVELSSTKCTKLL